MEIIKENTLKMESKSYEFYCDNNISQYKENKNEQFQKEISKENIVEKEKVQQDDTQNNIIPEDIKDITLKTDRDSLFSKSDKKGIRYLEKKIEEKNNENIFYINKVIY